MNLRHALLASVCTAFLAATAAASGSAAAESPSVARAQEGYRLLSSGDAAKAVAVYSEAIESRDLPADVLANSLLNRGLAHQHMGEHLNAVNDYSSAMRIDALGPKQRATALYNRGLAYQNIKRPALAIEDFTSALFLDSQFAHAYYSRGNALRDSGQLLFALSDYERAILYKHPQTYAVYYSEAVALEQLKRPADAQKSLLKSLVAKPDYQAARMMLAELNLPLPQATPGAAPATAGAEITGSTTKIAGGQTVQKTYLPPVAVLPPSYVDTAQAAAAPHRKLYTDRVPELVEVAEAPPKPKTEAAAEKIVAIEALPEDAESSAPAADETIVAEPAAAQPEAETQVETDTQAEPLTGWAVQLSSQRDEKVAWNVWGKMKARHKLLASQKPVVVKADLGTRGIFYRLRLAGFEDQSAAKGVCSKLKSRGIRCFVSKLDS